MRSILDVIVCLTFCNCFSQAFFEKMPTKTKKIHFLYEEKSNYYLDDTGVFADTLLIAFDFPKIKYSKVKNPLEQNSICGFLPYSAFSDPEDKRKLVQGELYHTNQTYQGTYYVDKNKTEIKIIRDDKDIKEKAKKIFNEYFPRFTMIIAIDYKKETENSIKTIWNGTVKFEPKYDLIYFDNDKVTGSYREKNNYLEMTNVVVFNKKLNPKISPAIFLSNAEFGVEKLITLFSTYVLKSVTYE
ncbi:hypothetical protein [Flavobacterium sp.]|uniref:hypothetical protein n=1 Tax=Flavobacterium sp. TaxID=239 RepID=UPI0025E9CA0F|nr:hypothetical protein [Flavobacterium sp.]